VVRISRAGRFSQAMGAVGGGGGRQVSGSKRSSRAKHRGWNPMSGLLTGEVAPIRATSRSAVAPAEGTATRGQRSCRSSCPKPAPEGAGHHPVEARGAKRRAIAPLRRRTGMNVSGQETQ